MRPLRFLLSLALLAIITALAYGFYRTVISERSPKQEMFAKGKFPTPLPNGLMKGTVDELTVSWKGKKMNAKDGTGINIFAGDNGDEERYPFVTAPAKGLRDPDLRVLRIDYDTPENPFWLRRITDEIVEVEEGKYLGKVHLRVIPGYLFTMGYFTLEK